MKNVISTYEVLGKRVSEIDYQNNVHKCTLKVLPIIKSELERLLEKLTPKNEITEIFTDRNGTIHLTFSESFNRKAFKKCMRKYPNIENQLDLGYILFLN